MSARGRRFYGIEDMEEENSQERSEEDLYLCGVPGLQSDSSENPMCCEREPELRERLEIMMVDSTYKGLWYIQDIEYLLEYIRQLRRANEACNLSSR